MAQEGPAPWYRKPLWLGFVGLGMIVGGWKLTTFVPEPPAIVELRAMAPDREYSEALDRYSGNRREPPFRLPGQLAVLAGLAMFATAAVQMTSASPAPPRNEDPEPDSE